MSDPDAINASYTREETTGSQCEDVIYRRWKFTTESGIGSKQKAYIEMNTNNIHNQLSDKGMYRRVSDENDSRGKISLNGNNFICRTFNLIKTPIFINSRASIWGLKKIRDLYFD